MSYKPKSGDIIWLDFDPQAGHEQKGSRPALIVWGNDALDLMPNMAQVCAISNTDNEFPLHISLQGATKSTSGFVLCEQNRVVDLKARNVVYKDSVSAEVLQKVKNTLKALLD
ncbi:MAG: type II toxin-antitoxin system PemK/MazF family toxin [Selenomonadaceae bacterium]|nr:type II toxin-antitoxin system PemK/MazF family toxin [Selenomonadaceae bacterium]